MEEEIQETQTIEEKKEDSGLLPKFKLFDKYDLSGIEIQDIGLKNAINIEPRLIVRSEGRHAEKLGQVKVNIIERLINRMYVAAHRGKKHKIEVGHITGQYSKTTKTVLEALNIIEKRKKENPVKVFVQAIENCAPRDEVTAVEYGGARYPQAVDVSPIRRVNIALRNIAHGASDKAFGKKKSLAQGLAEEIVLAADANGESSAFRRKNEMEKQADSAR